MDVHPILRRSVLAACVVAALLCLATPDSETLVDRLGADTAAERDEAAGKLLALGPSAIPALRRAADAQDESVRRRSAALLEMLELGAGPGSPARRRRASTLVRAALRDPQALAPGSDLDRAFFRALPESGDALAAAARRIGEHRLVPTAVAQGLTRYVTPESLATLVDLAEAERLPPSAVLEAARWIDGQALRDDGMEIASVLERLRGDLATKIGPRRKATVALFANLAGEDGANDVAAFANDPSASVRTQVARSLGEHAAVGQRRVLQRLTRDADRNVRVAALDALARLAGPLDPRTALRAADDPSPAVRAAAARLLALQDTGEGIRVLERLTADRSARVRAAAGRSLGRMETGRRDHKSSRSSPRRFIAR